MSKEDKDKEQSGAIKKAVETATDMASSTAETMQDAAEAASASLTEAATEFGGMTTEMFQKAEIPEAFRTMFRSSVEQARKAFDAFADSSEKTMQSFDFASAAPGGSAIREINDKIANITRTNADANFDLAMKLADAGDVSKVLELQTDHARKQMEAYAKQMEELRDLMMKMLSQVKPTGL